MFFLIIVVGGDLSFFILRSDHEAVNGDANGIKEIGSRLKVTSFLYYKMFFLTA